MGCAERLRAVLDDPDTVGACDCAELVEVGWHAISPSATTCAPTPARPALTRRKRSLAEQFRTNRDAYSAGKTAFIEQTLAAAPGPSPDEAEPPGSADDASA